MPELTEADRAALDRAEPLAEPATMDVIRERTGEADTTVALNVELAIVRKMLGDVIAIAKRLGGA